MEKKCKRVVVTGACGQLAYNIVFRIAKGDMLGSDQPIILHLLELPQKESALEGLKMELEDCAFPLLKEIKTGVDPQKMFEDVDYALFIGAKPRGPGMERKELFLTNGKIFSVQGKILNEVANPNVKVLVVGNPCNTNCMIAMSWASNLSKRNFHAMTRLDQNRAVYQLAKKAKVEIKDITKMSIWGNHSHTQVPDYHHAYIKGEKAAVVIDDVNWLEKEWTDLLQKRATSVINARGQSSAGSAASAAIDAIASLEKVSSEDQWFSSGVLSDGNPYGIQEGLVFSFPCFLDADKSWQIVSGLEINDVMRQRLQITEKELVEEKKAVRDLLGPNI